jgi:hypothetical protein
MEQGVISNAGNGKYRFVNHIKGIQIKTNSIPETQKIGTILGTLFEGVSINGKNVHLNDDDLIFLTTCFRPKEIAAALYVELDLFKERLLPWLYDYLKSEEGTINLEKIHAKIIKNDGHIALNSIHKKYLGWKTNGAQSAIDKGNSILQSLNNQIAEIDWNSYWQSLSILEREDENKIFNEIIEQMAHLGHRLLLQVYFINLTILLELRYSGNDSKAQLRDLKNKLVNFRDRILKIGNSTLEDNDFILIKHFETHYLDRFFNFDILKTKIYIAKEVDSILDKYNMVKAKASFMLESFEDHSDGSIFYDYLMHYDIIDSTAVRDLQSRSEVETYRKIISRSKIAINELILEIQRDAEKAKQHIYCWNGDPFSTNDGKYIFFTDKNNYAVRRIKELLDRLYYVTSGEISFRVIVSPTNVFWSKVFRRFQRTEVEGTHFWEHYSRLEQNVKEHIKELQINSDVICFVSRESNNEISKYFNLTDKKWDGEFNTNIGRQYAKTYGQIFINEKPI